MTSFLEPVHARVEMAAGSNSDGDTTVKMEGQCKIGEKEVELQQLAFACNSLARYLVGFYIFLLLLAIYVSCAFDTSVYNKII